MSEEKTPKWAMAAWVLVPYIMAPIFIFKNLAALKAGDNTLRMKAIGGAVWALIVIGMLSGGDATKKRDANKPAPEAQQPPAPSTPAPTPPAAPAQTAEQKPAPAAPAEKPRTAPVEAEAPPVNPEPSIEPACGDMAKQASAFWHVAEPTLQKPCGDRPHEEFALIEWKKCAKEKAAEIKAAEKEYKELTKQSFEVIDPEKIEFGSYNESKSAFTVGIPGIVGYPKAALTKPKPVFPVLANLSLVRDHDCVGFPWQWEAPNHSVHIPVSLADGPKFKKRHKPKENLVFSNKYYLGGCVSYTLGKTKNHKKKENNCSYGTLPGEKRRVDKGAGEITMATNIEVLVWSIPDKKILIDTAAE